jgi:hypothetical protein
MIKNRLQFKLKKAGLIGTAIVTAFLTTSCTTIGPNTQVGVVLGGIVGAAAGGIVGHQSSRGLEGAAIGAGLGLLAGGILGNANDSRVGLQPRSNRPFGTSVQPICLPSRSSRFTSRSSTVTNLIQQISYQQRVNYNNYGNARCCGHY